MMNTMYYNDTHNMTLWFNYPDTANLGHAGTTAAPAGDGCSGVIGSGPTSQSFAPQDTYTLSGISGLFLNTRNEATCNGTVTAWYFCYYINFPQNQTVLPIRVGVWRKEGDKYHEVNTTMIELSIPNQDTAGFQFACQYHNLQYDQTFEVLKGDIVGTCVQDLNEDLVPVLGTCGMTESYCGVIRTNISNCSITSADIMESDNSPHSLYLMAMIGLYIKITIV